MPLIVPDSWMPQCEMRGIVCHWTAGAYRASEVDREHYHIIIEGDGRLVRGEHSISDNVQANDNDYAAHTGLHNTKKIGVALACMAGASEAPFIPGKYPMTKTQWETMMLVNADLVRRYNIQITPGSLCGHGMVYAHHGQPNRTGKWDPLKLPFLPTAGKVAVDESIRTLTREALQNGPSTPVQPNGKPVAVFLDGTNISDDGFMDGVFTWVPLRMFAAPMGFSILDAAKNEVVLNRIADGTAWRLRFDNRGGVGYVPVRELREKIGGITTEWDGLTRTLRVKRIV